MQRQLPSQSSPLTRLISAALLLVVFAVSFAAGAVLFLVVLGLVVVLGVALYLRLRWLRHKWQQPPPPRQGGDVLEGEFTVKDEKPPTRH